MRYSLDLATARLPTLMLMQPGTRQRQPTPIDAPALDALFQAAYADPPPPAAAYFTAMPLCSASWLLLAGTRLLGACLIALDNGEPQIAYLATTPAWQRRGIGHQLLLRSLHQLQSIHFASVSATLTAANPAAEHLLRAIGFGVSGATRMPSPL